MQNRRSGRKEKPNSRHDKNIKNQVGQASPGAFQLHLITVPALGPPYPDSAKCPDKKKWDSKKKEKKTNKKDNNKKERKRKKRKRKKRKKREKKEERKKTEKKQTKKEREKKEKCKEKKKEICFTKNEKKKNETTTKKIIYTAAEVPRCERSSYQ